MDSNDRERVGEAKEELMRMLAEDELRDAVLLVFANKQVNLCVWEVKEVTIFNPLSDETVQDIQNSLLEITVALVSGEGYCIYLNTS